MTLFEEASVWLAGQLETHAGVPVVIERDGQQTPVEAVIGKTIFRLDNGYGIHERIESRDFLIATDKYAFDGEATLPDRGDRIRKTKGAETFVYEVMAPGREPAWRYSDAFRTLLRIHTKHIATE